MALLRSFWCAAVGAVLLTSPASAAPPPANDNYLSSTRMVGPAGVLPREYRDVVDTSAATTQPDLFNPNREGVFFGGGRREPTACGPTSYGKTVWYDFTPPSWGGMEIRVAGFDAVVAVHKWNPANTQLTTTVTCRNDSTAPAEDVLLPEVTKNVAYTVQVGGVATADGFAGGPLSFDATFFPDRDHDGILDEQPDKCPRQPGISAFGGCAPPLVGSPSLSFDRVAGGLRIARLVVDHLPAGTRAEARCRLCRFKEVRRARGGGRLAFRRSAGSVAPSGAKIELFLTKRRSGSGRFRFGAVGSYFRWRVKGSSLGTRVQRCLPPGSRTPRRCR